MIKNRGAHLTRILGPLSLSEVDDQQIIAYMQKRLAEPDTGGRTINLEIQILANALGRTWKYLWPRVKKLEENHDVGKALEPSEEQALMEVAARNQSKLIHPFLYTLAWTGMRSDEARTLRWGQVDFSGAEEIVIGGSKTEAGKGRQIPLNSNLKAVLNQHAAWYVSKVGPIRPDWYVFPLMNRLAIRNPSKPVTSLKTAWESVRTAAGVDCRLHDLRHTFCTKLAEAGVPESTMLDIMGHVSAAMLRRYSHIRVQARRDAMDAIEMRQFPIVVAKESAKVSESGSTKKAVTH
jgi:integrase